MWTITHVSNGVRVKTFSYQPDTWLTQQAAQYYLDRLIQVGDLREKILGQDADTLRVEEV